MAEDPPIDDLSSLHVSPDPYQNAPLRTLQDLEPPRKEAALPLPPPDLSEIQNIALHATPQTATVPSHRSHDPSNNLKRSDPFQFGSRYLEAGDDVFEWNAWDHVDPSADALFVAYAERQYAFQREHRVDDFDRRRFNQDPTRWWNRFYANNRDNFFKDRKWLRQEFPVLDRCTANTQGSSSEKGPEDGDGGDDDDGGSEEVGKRDGASEAPRKGPSREGQWVGGESEGPMNTILEIGAGAGNTAFPVLKSNRNPKLMIHANDFSKKAVELIRGNPDYDPAHIRAEVWDMSSVSQNLPEGVLPGSVDVVMLIFAFSALNPRQWSQAVKNVWTALRPGGEVCFRDYGRGDLAQVRFKKGRLLEENFYIRGDGTRVYFFDIEELRKIWGGGLADALPDFEDQNEDVEERQKVLEDAKSTPAFEIMALAADRRLLVNRNMKLKMYRCWMQGRFRKPNT